MTQPGALCTYFAQPDVIGMGEQEVRHPQHIPSVAGRAAAAVKPPEQSTAMSVRAGKAVQGQAARRDLDLLCAGRLVSTISCTTKPGQPVDSVPMGATSATWTPGALRTAFETRMRLTESWWAPRRTSTRSVTGFPFSGLGWVSGHLPGREGLRPVQRSGRRRKSGRYSWWTSGLSGLQAGHRAGRT